MYLISKDTKQLRVANGALLLTAKVQLTKSL